MRITNTKKKQVEHLSGKEICTYYETDHIRNIVADELVKKYSI
ncbi:MAG: hypothetical protein OEX79_07195 [Nitrosopumilus sp.]|nr:hypothetical protein [Nitrosopumilus sp.]